MNQQKSSLIVTDPSTGMRFVALQVESNVEYCGVMVGVGSRDEKRPEHGISHFIEHTIFKGTLKRTPSFIINRMEEIGGELNAYTTKEETVIYSIFPRGYLMRAASLISELVREASFRSDEIDKEREVILDEIESYRDSPAEAIYDDFDELIFKGSSMAHNILGNEKTIESFTSEQCQRFLADYYTGPSMIFFYSGPIAPAEAIDVAQKCFAGVRTHKPAIQRSTPPKNEKFDISRSQNNHQSHTIIGSRIPGLKSADRIVFNLLSNMLGGPGMNSILNVALRERRGLVYSVESNANMYCDCGTMTIYFGCDSKDAGLCREIIFREINKIAKGNISETKLNAACRQFFGQTIIASENREQEILSAARSVFYFNRFNTLREVSDFLEKITPDDIIRVANHITSDKLSMLTLS